MENVEFRRYIIGEGKKVTVAGARSRVDEFFMRLPYFQPWVWKLIAVLGIVGFFVGLGIGIWACYSLEK